MKNVLKILLFIVFVIIIPVGMFYYQQGTLRLPFRHFDSTKTALTDSIDTVKITVEDILPKTPCQQTLYYSFGRVDKKHNLTIEELHVVMKEAEAIWENQMNYNLFEYKSDADFKINFVFDERQERTLLSKNLDSELFKLKTLQKNIFAEHTALSNKYLKLVEKYKDDLEILEEKVENYNEDVEYWNKKGGAPEKKYAELLKDEEKISKLQKNLGSSKNLVKVTILVQV